MPQQPSRRDIAGPPPRNISDLAKVARHSRSNLRGLDPGFIDGRFATPQLVPNGPDLLVGGDGDGSAEDASAYEWQWDDRFTIVGTGTQVATLTYEPVEESLFVRWHPGGLGGGVPMINENFTVDGRQVTIPDFGVFAVNDRFSFQYQFDPGLEPEPAEILYVGATTATAGVSSMALPAGTLPGDLLVFGAASAALCSTADSRMTTVFTAAGAGGCVAYGITGSGTTPLACSVTGGAFDRAAAVLAVYRGVTVDSWSTQDSPTNDITLPVLSDSFAAIGVLLNWEGVVHGSINPDTTAAWTQNSLASASKNNVAVESWASAEIASTPPGAFHHGGDWAGFTATTLRLVGTA